MFGSYALLPFLTLAAFAVAALASSASPPCHAYSDEIESPCSEVLCKKEDGYEIRTYASGQRQFWTDARVKATNWAVVETMGFMKNYMYISGNNEQGKQMPMTAPVIFRPPSEQNEDEWSVSFFISDEYSQDIPKPKEADLDIVELVPKDKNDRGVAFAVITFGGMATEKDFMDQKDKLMNMLPPEVKTVSSNPWSVVMASYDSPMTLKNRHNEVWLMVENSDSVCDGVVEEA